jgi:hypothetical protein
VNLLGKSKSNPSRFILLAPKQIVVPPTFRNRWIDTEIHGQVLADMQRMRGRIALNEQAIKAKDLDREGRHRMCGDDSSWHLIRVCKGGKVLGCARILVHSEQASFSSLRLASSALAKDPRWAKRVRWTIEAEIAAARKEKLTLVEPGGWVLEERFRGTSEAVAIALSAFAWSQLIGDCLAYVTATVKHESSSILRRLGGDSVYFAGNPVPRYYEPRYQCEMELLKMQTRAMNSKFESLLAPLRESLSASTVLQPEPVLKTMSQWVA